MVELHYLDDWSLGEIAEQFGVSRQAVHDNLRRAEEQMEGYEENLHLFAQHADYIQRVHRLLAAWDDIKEVVPTEERRRMDEVLGEWRLDAGMLTGRDEDA